MKTLRCKEPIENHKYDFQGALVDTMKELKKQYKGCFNIQAVADGYYEISFPLFAEDGDGIEFYVGRDKSGENIHLMEDGMLYFKTGALLQKETLKDIAKFCNFQIKTTYNKIMKSDDVVELSRYVLLDKKKGIHWITLSDFAEDLHRFDTLVRYANNRKKWKNLNGE